MMAGRISLGSSLSFCVSPFVVSLLVCPVDREIENPFASLEAQLRNELCSPFLLVGGCLPVFFAIKFVCHVSPAQRAVHWAALLMADPVQPLVRSIVSIYCF